MAPSRKSKSVNKRFSSGNEVSCTKDGESASKHRQRKRKLSDMLGPQWTKEELEHFYEAYRKYGKDWKKVAAVVRNRTSEMIEALYTMNRAYLSLPEGTASVVGLIAMMTDHYCVLGGSDSEQESNEDAGTPRKPQKRARAKSRDHPSKGLEGLSDRLQFQSAAGCLSLLKNKRTGSTPRAVGKRTPRVPVFFSYDKDNRGRYISPVRQSLKLKAGAMDDDVAHEIALALTEASQKGGSPQVSQTLNRKTKTHSPVRKGERMHTESDMTSPKFRGSDIDEGCCELSLGSTEADNGDYTGNKNYLMTIEGSSVVEAKQKGGRYRVTEAEIDDSENRDLDDIKEACSGTEEGKKLDDVQGDFEATTLNGKAAKSSNKCLRKRSKKVLFRGDEGTAFDALQTLADMSLMMPESIADTESFVQVKEEKSNDTRLRESVSIPRVKAGTLKASKLRKLYDHGTDATPEAEGTSQSNAPVRRTKIKSSPYKIPMDEAPADSLFAESPRIEVKDEVKKPGNKGKRSHSAAHVKQIKLLKPYGPASSSNDHVMEVVDSAPSAVQVVSPNQITLPTKVRSRRKIETKNLIKNEDANSSENIMNGQSDAAMLSLHGKALRLKEHLSNFLSRNQARQWCAFEWFYSAVDYPWFSKKEFLEYLNHVGLGHVPRLTRVEWGVIRSSLGKPRRFSEQFLKEEKEKLNQYRESVRKHYAELNAGTREGLPTDLARPLKVGQNVIALHPRERKVHDGSVLTVDHNRCRIQFDRPELGVELVKDTDCMPLHPLENMPSSITQQNITVDRFIENLSELKMNEQQYEKRPEASLKFSQCDNLEKTHSPHTNSSFYDLSCSLQPLQKGGLSSFNSQVKVGVGETSDVLQPALNSQLSYVAQIQAREADVQALSELTRFLDKKEAVVSELKRMNDEVLENHKDGHNTFKDSESFKKQYAAVLFQLSEVNDQVSSALFRLRQRNTYQENSSHIWLKPMESLGDPGGHSSYFNRAASDVHESGSHVTEIVENSRAKAQEMVDSAMQALISLRKEKNNVKTVEEAIDFVNSQLSTKDTSADPVLRPLDPQEQQSSVSTSPPLESSDTPDPELNLHNTTDAQFPSELIARCVATLLMIQKCTERQFPPGDVAQVLNSAVTSLQPCCSKNLPVYEEIEKCMGIIRNQILALIPT